LILAHAVTASAGHHGHSSPRGDGSDNLVVNALDTQGVGPDDNSAQAGHLIPAIALSNRGRAGGPAETLRAGSHGALPMVALELSNQGSGGNVGWSRADRPFRTLDTSGPPGLPGPAGVRRLTPTECERLQGFPDGWTRYGTHPAAQALGIPNVTFEQPDSPRYRQLGNAVAMPVARWIAERILAVDQAYAQEAA
jgi:DNA (cytosine-5)-methyltransferase 1